MQILADNVDVDGFFESIRDAPARLLMLDYDGTLAPFRPERDQAVPAPGVREAVKALLDAGHTRVVVVSGRAVDDLLPLLGMEPAPEIWGTHGWERYRPGEGVEQADPGPEARSGLERALERARAEAPDDEIEVKPASVAVHVRSLDPTEGEALVERMRRAWTPVAETAGLDLHDFDGGLEIRVPGRDKGTAVSEILRVEPRGVAAAYLGDDRTDEDAFEALEGRGLRVLVREEARETAADVRIRPPDELLAFLARWNRASTPE